MTYYHIYNEKLIEIELDILIPPAFWFNSFQAKNENITIEGIVKAKEEAKLVSESFNSRKNCDSCWTKVRYAQDN